MNKSRAKQCVFVFLTALALSSFETVRMGTEQDKKTLTHTEHPFFPRENNK